MNGFQISESTTGQFLPPKLSPTSKRGESSPNRNGRISYLKESARKKPSVRQFLPMHHFTSVAPCEVSAKTSKTSHAELPASVKPSKKAVLEDGELTATIMHDKNSREPEWVDAKEVKRIFSLGKTTLYRLASINKIKSASLREDDKQRGKRLFCCASIRAFLESLASNPPQSS